MYVNLIESVLVKKSEKFLFAFDSKIKTLLRSYTLVQITEQISGIINDTKWMIVYKTSKWYMWIDH